MDLVAGVEKFPETGQTIFGKSFERFPGGKGANQAVMLGKLGAQWNFLVPWEMIVLLKNSISTFLTTM